MDDTIELLLQTWLRRINEACGRNVQPDDVVSWNLEAAYPGLTREQVYGAADAPGFWKDVLPMPGAAEALKHFMDAGHEVYIVTATEAGHVREKMEEVLFKYFPFLSWSQVIITCRKQMIRGDVLIDDGIHNLEGGEYKKILFTAPYNRSYDAEAHGMIRVHNWEEAVRAVDRMAAGE
jgi:5'(3')-deoxyribonucleotidase